MSEWVPTTEEVKANYALVGDDEVVNNINEQKFDRWLAQHDAEVAKATEKRIIALLNRSYPRLNGAAEWATALIKGDNK